MTIIFPIKTSTHREVLGVALALGILAFSARCLRLLAHHIAHKKWMVSDSFLIAAGVKPHLQIPSTIANQVLTVFAVGLQSMSTIGVFQAGIGQDNFTAIAVEYEPGPITKLLQLIVPLQFL